MRNLFQGSILDGMLRNLPLKGACRECGTIAHALDAYCPQCGQHEPLQVPCGSTIVVAAASIVAILAIRTGSALSLF
jgi:uncharacterized OB-fold protein